MFNKKILLPLILSGMILGCSNTPDDLTPTTEEDIENIENPFSVASVIDEVFYLKEIDFAQPPVKENNVTLIFSNAKHFKDVIKGNAGCNNYFTNYSTTRSTLITGEIATTDKQCDYDQMQIEGFMFKIFSQNPIIALKGNKLYMKGIKNKLTFEKKVKVLSETEIEAKNKQTEDYKQFEKMNLK